jgi:phosphatidylglycerol:prolipoprotein diacylglycerol transferase
MSLFPTRQILLAVGPLQIHWYGVMYLLAFLVAWWLIPILAKKRHLEITKDQISNLLFAGILGTLIGGRLGYVVFYGAEYFGDHPFEILAVWNGGMSSHGGFIGVFIALWIAIKRMRLTNMIWQIADVFVVPIALGLALGRVGNFINFELYGPVSDLPWAIAIPGVEGLRHPTPLYAVAKNLLIAGFCYAHLTRSQSTGATTGLFLILYGIFRFLIEEVRIETASSFDIGVMELTRGQMLTIPILIIGIFILKYRSN